MTYHARETMRGRPSCGAISGTSRDTLAEWVRDELRHAGVWTEPEPGAQLCARCLAVLRRELTTG